LCTFQIIIVIAAAAEEEGSRGLAKNIKEKPKGNCDDNSFGVFMKLLIVGVSFSLLLKIRAR
jgi:hypothetical protein